MKYSVAVLGATSMVAPRLMEALHASGITFVALTRQVALHGDREGVRWCALGDLSEDIEHWICLAPIWSVAECLPFMRSLGARKVIALSSTSAESKCNSHSSRDRETAARLVEGERALAAWAHDLGVEWVVLRTTMIHGDGRDRNVAEIRRWLRRWRVFPLIGGGRGLRQPVHAVEVASACMLLIEQARLPCAVLNLVGGEVLSYREMVERIACVAGVRFVFLPLPCWLARSCVRMLSRLPRYRHLTPALADRMNDDLVFDGGVLQSLIDFRPALFVPDGSDSGAVIVGTGR